jgi:hypothetical protein
VANTLKFSRNGAVGFIDWLDLFGGIELTLRMILKHPSGTAKQKSDNNDRDERAGDRARHKPSIELKSDDEHDHGYDSDATTAKNAEGENT